MILKQKLREVLHEGSALSPAAKASMWYAVCGILQKGIGVIVVPLYTRIMDPAAYGTYTVFQSWFTLLFVFTSLGLANYVFNNGMVRFEHDRDAFTSAMLGLSLASTLVFTTSFFAFPSFWLNLLGLSAPIAFLLFFRALISPCYELWSARLRYEFRYKGVVALTLILTIAVPVVSIPAILLAEDKAAAALVAQVGVMLVVYAVPFVSIVRRSPKLFDGRYWVYALKFNLPLIPSLFATLALQQLNRIIIAGTVGDGQAAIYSVAFSVGSVAMFVYSALEQAYRPWFYQGMAKSRSFVATNVAILVISAVGAVCVAISLFAPEIMQLFAPIEYWDGMYAIAPIAASNVLIMLFSVYITVEYFFEETIPIPLISIAAALVNYVLSSALVPMFGYISASYVTLLCYFLLAFGHAVLCRRTMRRHHDGRSPISVLKLFAFSLAVVCVIVSIQLLYRWLVVRLCILVFVVAALLINRGKLLNAFNLLKKKPASSGEAAISEE